MSRACPTCVSGMSQLCQRHAHNPFSEHKFLRVFQDFDVGKTYKKKISMTNVSYSVNYCKLTGLTEHLKDFIQIQ